jgi:uncharacterized membrane protein
MNNGNEDVTVNITSSGLNGFGIDFSDNFVTIASGSSQGIMVTISAPLGQLADDYTFSVTAATSDNCDSETITGNVTVLPSTDVDVCGDLAAVEVAPGGSDDYDINVVNPNSNGSNVCDSSDGPANEDLVNVSVSWDDLMTEGNDPLTFTGTVDLDAPTSLASGSTASLSFTVTAGAEEITGVYTTMVTVQGEGAVSGDLVEDHFTLQVTVNPNPSLELTGNATFTGDPGEDVSVTLTVTNTGNVTLTGITLGHTFPQNFNVSFDQPAFSLSPDDSRSVQATVVIPMPDVACVGTYNGQINVSSGNETATAFLAAAVNVNALYAFALDVVEGGLSYSGQGGDQNLTRSFTIVNTGNATLSGFAANGQLNGIVEGQLFTGAINFSLPSAVDCGASAVVQVSVNIAGDQEADTYEGTFDVSESHLADALHLNINVKVLPAASLVITGWAGNEVSDGDNNAHIGVLTVQNNGNSDLDDVTVEVEGGGFKLTGFEGISIPSSDVSFEPKTFSLAKGSAAQSVNVYAAVPLGFLNGVYHGVLRVYDTSSEAEKTMDVSFTVTHGRDYTVGPNPVEYPDYDHATFYFEGPVTGINIYNMGAELVREVTGINSSSYQWNLTNDNGDDVASGLYLCLLMNGDTVQKQLKLLVVKTEQ